MRMCMPSNSIDSLFNEPRHFPPSAEFAASSVNNLATYDDATADRERLRAASAPP